MEGLLQEGKLPNNRSGGVGDFNRIDLEFFEFGDQIQFGSEVSTGFEEGVVRRQLEPGLKGVLADLLEVGQEELKESLVDVLGFEVEFPVGLGLCSGLEANSGIESGRVEQLAENFEHLPFHEEFEDVGELFEGLEAVVRQTV